MKHLKKFNEEIEPWNLRKTPGEEDVHWTDDMTDDMDGLLSEAGYLTGVECKTPEEALKNLSELDTDESMELYAKIETLQEHEDLKQGMYKMSSEVIGKSLGMKQWCVTTTSESSDHYIYFIEHPTKPTKEELEKFLFEQGNDVDEEQSYESVDMCVEIKNFKRLS